MKEDWLGKATAPEKSIIPAKEMWVILILLGVSD